MPLSLDERLELASKKFTKACEQIKVLKQQITVNLTMYANFTEMPDETAHDLNLNRNRETLRQKIETLQNFKNIFYMYAHRKADEITKIQCELYGEDAVRNAYDGTNNTSNNNDQETSNEINGHVAVEGVVATNENDESWTEGYWTNESNAAHSQLQLTEYDFLTA